MIVLNENEKVVFQKEEDGKYIYEYKTPEYNYTIHTSVINKYDFFQIYMDVKIKIFSLKKLKQAFLTYLNRFPGNKEFVPDVTKVSTCILFTVSTDYEYDEANILAEYILKFLDSTEFKTYKDNYIIQFDPLGLQQYTEEELES